MEQPVVASRSSFDPPTDSDEAGNDGNRFRVLLVAAVWLVYLSHPLQTILKDADRPVRALGLVALTAFCVCYLAFFHHARRRRRALERDADRRAVVLVLAMLALVALMVPAAGGEALAGLVYVSASMMMIAPLPLGWLAPLALLALAEGSALVVPGWEDQSGTGLAIVLAAVAVFGLRMAMDRSRQLLVARDDLARLAVEQERTRFARDLHDILGHSLTVVTVKAELAGRLVESDPQGALREIADVEWLSREALADVRAAVSGYRGVTLAAELASARSTLAAAGIEADLPTAVDHVPGESRELFGWAVREGVTNVVRHSRAGRCTVVLTPTGVEIVDDGRGAAVASLPHGASPGAGGGHGLVGLRERAEAVGARVVAGSVEPHGFRLRVETAEVSA